MAKAFYNTQMGDLQQKQIMLDLETLGKTHKAPIIQIGICVFNGLGEIFDQFKATVDISTLDMADACGDTVKWWLNREQKAIDSIKKGNLPIQTALTEAASFMLEVQKNYNGALNVWSHATFDVPVLNHSMNKYGVFAPYKYYQAKDIRTLNWIAGDVVLDREGVHHDALDDAIFQAKYCALMMQKILKPKTVRI